jgi:hypothetical protein
MDFKTAKPREVEAYLREQVRKALGDKVENASTIISSSGYYTVTIRLSNDRTVDFDNFRKKDAPKIAKAIRALK